MDFKEPKNPSHIQGRCAGRLGENSQLEEGQETFELKEKFI